MKKIIATFAFIACVCALCGCSRDKSNVVTGSQINGSHAMDALKTEASNPVILADMKESGVLFASEEITHS